MSFPRLLDALDFSRMRNLSEHEKTSSSPQIRLCHTSFFSFFARMGNHAKRVKCALCTVDDASCFHRIRLGPKTFVYEKHDSVKSTETGCDVTNRLGRVRNNARLFHLIRNGISTVRLIESSHQFQKFVQTVFHVLEPNLYVIICTNSLVLPS